MEGDQDNSFRIGNTSISFDWIQPVATPLIIGARLYELAQGIDADEFKEKSAYNKATEGVSTFVSVITGGADAIFEQSFLQTLSDILSKSGNDNESGFTNLLTEIPPAMISQSVPTVVGQLARTIDPIQRKTKGNNETETILNSIAAKLPWASTTLEPKLDAFGQEVQRGNSESWLENTFNQLINPSDTTHQTYSEDDAVREMMRVFKETDDTRACPVWLRVRRIGHLPFRKSQRNKKRWVRLLGSLLTN